MRRPVAKRTGMLGEFWLFIRQHKAYWMIPIVAVLLIFILLIALGSTGAAPFIYTVF